jgi:hypothetical protein
MLRLVLATLLALAAAVAAADKTGVIPNAGLTGSWFNPDQNGHGFIFEFIDDTTVLAYWFTFDPDGNRTWLFGVGTVDDKEFTIDMSTVEGGIFPPFFDPELTEVVSWGTVTFSFSSCTEGTATWQPNNKGGYQAGSMPIEPITTLQGLPCENDGVEGKVIPLGKAPTFDGRITTGEWDDAHSVPIVVNAGWTSMFYYKRTETSLYFAFDNLDCCGNDVTVIGTPGFLAPEVVIDVGAVAPPSWQTGLFWFHASFLDCSAEGLWGVFFGCAQDLPGWAATNFPVTGSGVIEISIPFDFLGIDPAQAQNLRLAATLTDQGTGGDVFHYYPTDADFADPPSWELMAIVP